MSLCPCFRFKNLKQPCFFSFLFSPRCIITKLLTFLWCKFNFAKHTATAALTLRQMSGSPSARLMCADSDVRASKCKLISDWGILCARRDCFLLHAVAWFKSVSTALWPSVCLFVGGYACCHALSLPLQHVLLSVGVTDGWQAANLI